MNEEEGKKVPYIQEIKMADIIPKLPMLTRIDSDNDFKEISSDIFICALGFEERAIAIPHRLGNLFQAPSCIEGCYIEYSTNIEDNETNRESLELALHKFCNVVSHLQGDSEDFSQNIRQTMNRLTIDGKIPSVIFDVSGCSSKLILLVLKVLFEFDVTLKILYTEAAVYHPTEEEIKLISEDGMIDDAYAIAKGVASVSYSKEHPGINPDCRPDAVVVFPTFKPERSKSVLAYVDESLLDSNIDRAMWIIGEPHLEKDFWRKDYSIKINSISENSIKYSVSTFNYAETIEVLEKIYRANNLKYHLVISPLGSKMQSIGIAFFCYMKPEVSIVFSQPISYNADHYSEGHIAIWAVDFQRVKKNLQLLNSVGNVILKNRSCPDDFLKEWIFDM